MRAKKVSLSLEAELLAEARGRDRLASLLAELEQETKPIDPEVMATVRRAWPAPGEKAAKRRSS